jgi:hypothetical protein
MAAKKRGATRMQRGHTTCDECLFRTTSPGSSMGSDFLDDMAAV